MIARIPTNWGFPPRPLRSSASASLESRCDETEIICGIFINVFLRFTFSTAPKRPAPKRPAPKRQAPKRQAPKRPAPKRPAPKRQEPKRQAPKRQAPKRPVRKRRCAESPGAETIDAKTWCLQFTLRHSTGRSGRTLHPVSNCTHVES